MQTANILEATAQLIKEHGAGAENIAVYRADRALAERDFDGFKFWMRVARATVDKVPYEAPASL